MITTAILNIIYFFVLGIALLVAQFGDVEQNSEIVNAILTLRGYYVSLADYLPLNTIVAIIAFDLAFEGIYFVYKLIRWSYKKVPMIN